MRAKAMMKKKTAREKLNIGFSALVKSGAKSQSVCLTAKLYGRAQTTKMIP